MEEKDITKFIVISLITTLMNIVTLIVTIIALLK